MTLLFSDTTVHGDFHGWKLYLLLQAGHWHVHVGQGAHLSLDLHFRDSGLAKAFQREGISPYVMLGQVCVEQADVIRVYTLMQAQDATRRLRGSEG